MTSTSITLAASSSGRVSGKNWKTRKTATVRSNLPTGVKTKSWQERKRKDTQMAAVKALQKELKDEKLAEIQRWAMFAVRCGTRPHSQHGFDRRKEITKERKERAEERKRLEEMKAKMSAKKLARMRRRQGRTKKING
ncbi:rRNA-processing protein {ECO:0000256/RuleBase:RU363084} [Serendipita indica DSM 11827]|nr:rRNA-processing protein {ECO:0000256/RuleBase:RU363084} [Serendipita indica DSM 11827]